MAIQIRIRRHSLLELFAIKNTKLYWYFSEHVKILNSIYGVVL